MDFTGWSTDAIAYQLQLEQESKDDLTALLAAGIPLDTAKRLAHYNPTLDGIDLRDLVEVRVSRSPARVNSDKLEGAVLDAAKLYSVFVPDIPELGIISISFNLNGFLHHTEASTPWDYDGTAGGGEANRVTFVAGADTITAIVTTPTGTFSVDADFNVE